MSKNKDLNQAKKAKNERIDKILKYVKQKNDTTVALCLIESAILLDCCDEGSVSVDKHVLTKTETQAIIGRLLTKALTLLGNCKMPGKLKSFNADEQNNNHDDHTKSLINLIDNEFRQMKKKGLC